MFSKRHHSGRGFRDSLYKLGLFLTLILLAGSACDRRVVDISSDSCNIALGFYYDFATQRCVIPRDREQLYRLSLFDRLHTLSSRNNVLTNYKVSFSHWLNGKEAQKYFNDPRIVRIEMVELYFPDIARGVRAPIELPLSSVKRQSIQDALKATRKVFSDVSDALPDLPAQIDSAIEKGAYQIAVVRFSAIPTDIISWWVDHSDSVRFIQAMANDADEMQRSFEPEEVLP